MKQIKICIKHAAQMILNSHRFAAVSAFIGIGTLVSFLVCCVLQQIGVFETNSTWIVVWLFTALSLTSIFFLITWAAIIIEACYKIDEE